MIKEHFLGARLAEVWQPQTQQLVYMQLLNAFSFVGKVNSFPNAALSEGASIAPAALPTDSGVTSNNSVRIKRKA